MKKLRIQPSFASLTEDEIEQLACMAQRETFAVVLERARKPRSEGGFGLTMRSESPLERLLDKKNKLDLINAQITDGKKLTLADLNSITAGVSGPCGEHRPEEVHDAIMSATYLLVTERDNTPHQLLALQRLADFPARAELREQSAQIRAQSAQDLSRLRNQSLAHRTERMQITRAKEARAQAKAHREAEMHTHKIAMDLRKQTHKEKTAAFKQDLALHRLNLTLNRNLFPSADASSSDDSFPEDTQHFELSTQHLDRPTSISRDAITDTDAASADPNASASLSQQGRGLGEGFSHTNTDSVLEASYPSSNRKQNLSSETQNSKLKTQNSNTASSFLSPAVLENTNLYDQKIDAGEIRVIYAPGKHYEIEYCNPADQPALERLHTSGTLRFFEDSTRTKWLPALRTFGKNPYIPPRSSSP